MEYEHSTLSNGLRLIHFPMRSEVAYCGFAIDVGSRDEEKGKEGMAHFVEHLLFKGTQHHSSSYILNRMEEVGGELNAYTTKEDTFVYSIFMRPDFNRAAELLTDMVFSSTFPQKEVKKEADVIVEEINSYKDTPSELIFDEFENLLFENHPLGHNILGEEEKISHYTSEQIGNFVQNTYDPSKMVFFSLGKMNFKQIKKTLERLMENYPSHSSRKRIENTPHPISFQKKITKDTFQTHVLMGSVAYTLMQEKERTALYLLNNILGGPGMNSRLNLSLREKKGWVYEVESSATSFSDTGMFSVYFACDKHNVEKCTAIVLKELKHFKEEKLTSLQLDRAKKQLRGQMGVANDNRENLALALGKSFLRLNCFESLEETFARIDQISPSFLLEVANYVFDENRLSCLTYY